MIEVILSVDIWYCLCWLGVPLLVFFCLLWILGEYGGGWLPGRVLLQVGE